jgi:hypothetical protein
MYKKIRLWIVSLVQLIGLVIELMLMNELITKCKRMWNEWSLYTINSWII